MKNFLRKTINFFYIIILYTCQSVDNRGLSLYNKYCLNCHQENGKGLGKIIPPINGSVFLEKNLDLLPCIIYKGIKDTLKINGIVFPEKMPGI